MAQLRRLLTPCTGVLSSGTGGVLSPEYSFFSELSSKRDLGSECYDCLCAFFTAVRRYYSSREDKIIDGLIYPSAMSEAKGLNIVMPPYSVDSKLLPEKIQMIRFAYSNVIKFNYLISPCSEALEVDGDTFVITDYKKSNAENK